MVDQSMIYHFDFGEEFNMSDNSVVSKSRKNGVLPPARVGEERDRKLQAMCEVTGKSISAILRELIDKGKIEFISNGKELIRDVAELHRKLNYYSLKMSSDIQAVQEDIQKINLLIQDSATPYEQLELYLTKASLRLDDLENRYNEKITICTRIFPVRSDDNGNF